MGIILKNVYEVLVQNDGVETKRYVIAADLNEGLKKVEEVFSQDQSEIVFGIKFICKIDFE